MTIDTPLDLQPIHKNMILAVRRLSFLLLFLFVNIAVAQEAPRYTVKQGDTLYGIARTHNMSVDELKRLNNLSSNTIRPGQNLIVGAAVSPPPADPRPVLPDPVFEPARDPVQPRQEETTIPDATPETNAITVASAPEEPLDQADLFKPLTRAKRSYTIKPGDTYYSIAVEYGIPAYAIFAINGGDTGPLEPKDTIWIPDTDPITSFSESDEPPTYTVRQGDTLYGIARKSGASVQSIRDANDLSGNVLSIGQVIVIPAPTPVAKPRDQQLPPIYESGKVTLYPETYAGRMMASGAPYDPARFTVSHPELALETIVLLTNPESGRSTFAEVTDRGPLDTSFSMDVSAVVARELGITEGVDQEIQIRVVE